MTPEELEAARRDAENLRAAVSGLEAGLAKQHMEASLASLERIISKAESGEGPYTLQIVCPGRTFTVHLPATATVGQLREAVLRESGVAHTHSALTAAGVGDLNEAPADTPLASSELPREAELTLSLKQAPAAVNARAGVTATSAAAALAQARRAGVSASSSLESLALALHCFMLQSGFVCTGTDEGAAVSGFAPPVRDVPEGQVVPKDWNSVTGAISFKYRRNSSKGVYLLKLLQVDTQCIVHLGTKDGAIETAEFDLAEHETATVHSGDTENTEYYEKLRTQFKKALMDKVLPPDTTTSATATSTSRDTSRRDEHDTDYDPLRVGPPRMPGPLPLPGMGPVPDGSPGFGGERRGDFSGDLMPGVGGGFPGSGGSLMGPDHPMFGGPSGMGYPQPRWDPYGPPLPGQPGGPGRGLPFPDGNGGRGNGRRGQQPPFGGPNPDHLPPPGPNNMFF